MIRSRQIAFFWRNVYISDILDLQQHIMSLHHNIKIAEHAEYWKMLKLVS